METAEKYDIDPVVWNKVMGGMPGENPPTLGRIVLASVLCREILRSKKTWKTPTSLRSIVDLAAECHPTDWVERIQRTIEISLQTHSIFDTVGLIDPLDSGMSTAIFIACWDYSLKAAKDRDDLRNDLFLIDFYAKDPLMDLRSGDARRIRLSTLLQLPEERMPREEYASSMLWALRYALRIAVIRADRNRGYSYNAVFDTDEDGAPANTVISLAGREGGYARLRFDLEAADPLYALETAVCIAKGIDPYEEKGWTALPKTVVLDAARVWIASNL